MWAGVGWGPALLVGRKVPLFTLPLQKEVELGSSVTKPSACWAVAVPGFGETEEREGPAHAAPFSAPVCSSICWCSTS